MYSQGCGGSSPFDGTKIYLQQATFKSQWQQRIMPFLRCSLALACLFIPLSLAAQTEPSSLGSYQSITGKQRLTWFVTNTIGPESLDAGLFTAAFGTATNGPREYGPHWGGFADRYGMRFTGISTGNAMEAGFGSLWNEDPRYFRTIGFSFKGRMGNVMKMTFAATRADGHSVPAYARFIAIPGNNFLSNTWRADSEADASHAALRTLYGVLGRMGSNAFQEFWPDVKQRVFHRKH
jgi:hypothetical protein